MAHNDQIQSSWTPLTTLSMNTQIRHSDFRSCNVLHDRSLQQALNHHRLNKICRPETAASSCIDNCRDRESWVTFFFVSLVLYGTRVRESLYYFKLLQLFVSQLAGRWWLSADGSTQNYDDDYLHILNTVFQTSAQKADGHHSPGYVPLGCSWGWLIDKVPAALGCWQWCGREGAYRTVHTSS